MSIASEITRIKNNIASAYTECNNQGATMPTNQNSANLANCINSISGSGTYPIGITRGVDANGVYGYPTTNFAFALPSTATKITNTTLKETFNGCTTITSVDMSSITEINGADVLENFCNNCTNLTSVDLSGVTTINGSGAMDYAFSNTSITGVDLSSLQTISSSAMTNTFKDCPNISSIDLSSLTTLASGVSLNGTFSLSNNPTSPLPLTSVTFTSLATVNGTSPMRNIFAKRDGLTIYFPAFNSNTFGVMTTYLDNIVSGAVGCTVHFPSNMQSIIGNWSSVQNGFGGTNTTVLFDLPATS